MSATHPIVAHIHRVNAIRDRAEKSGNLSRIHQLQEWQCERLLATHKDLAGQPKYQQAMGFFVDELYGPKDFSQRDADIARVVPKLSKALPQKAMNALDGALALNALSFELDNKMITALDGASLDRDSYARAYREVGEQDAREKQLDMIEALGLQLADIVKIRGIGLLIKMSRQPAKLAGLLTLHEFLQRGYKTFRELGDVKSFIEPVVRRERALMETLLRTDLDLDTENPLPHVSR